MVIGSKRSKPASRISSSVPGRSQTGPEPHPALRERLGHAVKHAEPVEHCTDGMNIVLEPVLGLELEHQEGAFGIESAANLTENRIRVRQIVHAVEGGDERERRTALEGVDAPMMEAGAVGDSGRLGRGAGPAR